MGCRRLQRYVARCLSLVQIANEESCRHRRRTLGNGLSTRHLRKRTRRVTFRELLTKGTLGSARHATFNLRLTRSCSFHTTLFPANGTQVPFLTYRRISTKRLARSDASSTRSREGRKSTSGSRVTRSVRASRAFAFSRHVLSWTNAIIFAGASSMRGCSLTPRPSQTTSPSATPTSSAAPRSATLSSALGSRRPCTSSPSSALAFHSSN